MILGIDEVRRGPWAGPLVVGAVVLGHASIEGLTDSKKLTKKKLRQFNVLIHTHAQATGLGWVHADEIDAIGLSAALRLATIRAVEHIHAPYHEIIIDGTINFLKETAKGAYVTTLPKADLLVPAVSAASIIAKVARDDYMIEQSKVYPMYGFDAHVGYGTKAHRDAIARHGITPLHRTSFAPLKPYASPLKNTTKKGDAAETMVAQYLEEQGYEVIDRNWKTRYCELDIVAIKNNELYIIEVKHRQTSKSGDGIAAITESRRKQLAFGAELYHTRTHQKPMPIHLMVVATSGTSPVIETVLEIE